MACGGVLVGVELGAVMRLDAAVVRASDSAALNNCFTRRVNVDAGWIAGG